MTKDLEGIACFIILTKSAHFETTKINTALNISKKKQHLSRGAAFIKKLLPAILQKIYL